MTPKRLPQGWWRAAGILALLPCGGWAMHAADGPAIAPVPPQAAARVATVRVIVAPDHRDWTYQLGEPVRFRVTITADNEPLDDVPVTVLLGQEQFEGAARPAVVPAAGLTIDGGTLKEPGFLRCTIETDVAGHHYRGLATAAFAPEKIEPYQTAPDDFDAFWADGLAKLAKVPLEPRLTLLPDACTDKVNVYHVSFRTYGPEWTSTHARMYGILCEPKQPGKYPALLRLPGAGVRPYFGDKGFAAEGAITLEIGIHGIPVNLPQEVYDALQPGALDGYYFANMDDREAYYYHRVYLGCIRANDFLASRPDWDGQHLVVAGASQGGELTIMTAALDPRVTALAATHPAYCDVVAELHGRAAGWPRPFHRWVPGQPSPHEVPAEIAVTRYYDTVNFARRLKVPGFYTWGYNDEVCAPTSLYAAYNVITAPKQLAVTLELGHAYTQEQGDAVNAWLRRQLGLTAK
jgi:cephalosporin-C deacetylase-like acetyl esterase